MKKLNLVNNILICFFLTLSLNLFSQNNSALPNNSNNGNVKLEIMKKYKVETLIDIEIMDLKDMVTMLKEIYHLTATDKKLELSLIELTKKLEESIAGEKRGFDFSSLKPKISDEEKKLDQQLAQKTAEIESLNKSIKNTQADIDRMKQVIQILDGNQNEKQK